MRLSALAAVIALTTAANAQNSESLSPALVSFYHHVHHVTIAHGTIMCLAFVVFFPAGSLLIRLGHFKGALYVHAGIQFFAYMMALAGMGMGVYIANSPTRAGGPSWIHKYHPIIGLTIISALLFQPVLGALHHAVYVRRNRRSIWSTLHVWWGRIVLTLAIIQGGLGLRFANNTTGGKIAYGVIAGLIWVTWFGVALRHDIKKRKIQDTGEKRSDSEEMSPIGKEETGST